MMILRPVVSACAIALMMIFGCADADFTADCPTMCDCKWQSGNKAANCSQRKLTEVPDKLSSEIQNVDLSKNPLIDIPHRAFERVSLNSLKKLRLHDCKLSNIDKDGFSGLSIMIELDLSKNNIKTLHPSTFNETIKLRHLIISENKLDRIEDGLFNDLPYLQKIDLGHNFIYMLGTNSFGNLPMLKTIVLESNSLSHVNLETINKLKSIASLVLHDNPWKCDCNLRSFRNWVIDRNLYTQSAACAEPESLLNKLWNELSSGEFACGPQILEPFQGTTIKTNGKSITLSCNVVGNPTPQVYWVQNSKILGNDSRKNHITQRYEIKETKTHGVSARWTNLTIIYVEYEDSGEYTCIAKNPAGVENRTVSLNVSRTYVATTGNPEGDTILNMHTWSIWRMVAAVGIILIILIIALLFCIDCKKRYNKMAIYSDMRYPNGKPLIEGSVVPEIQRSLSTTLNPLKKPARRYDTLSSVSSDATEMTEMSEMSKVSLTKDFANAQNEDENHYMNIDDLLLKCTREKLLLESARENGQPQFPPDFVFFSPKGSQISLASSSASTATDGSRRPLKDYAQSLSHSSIYSQNSLIYGSLPRSTSQSQYPPITLNQKYITLPRRPHAHSRSSISTTPALPKLVEYEELVNDNLGLRTTASGSSVLSLNKAGLDQQLSPIVRIKELIILPGGYEESSPTHYTCVEEMKRAPASTSSITFEEVTHPRENGNSVQLQLSPNTAEPLEPRRKNQLEPGSVKRFNPIDDNNRQTLTPMGNKLYDPIYTRVRSRKIPPPPPPKPKKKIPTDTNGPLFEEDGEDGTEV